MNRILKNMHAVPLTDLMTVNVLVIVGLAYVISKYMKLSTNMSIGVLIALVVVSVFLHPKLNVPDNLSYYFSLGPKPDGWRGA